jgi:hypothetical protein
MCGFCAVFAGIPHWTEAGSDAAHRPTETSGPEARRARLVRIQLIDRIARCYGCRVEDWMGEQYIVRSQRGRTEIVRALPLVWSVIEDIAGCAVDPLDPRLLAALHAANV